MPSEGSKGPWASTAWPSSPSRAELGQHGVDMGFWDRVVNGCFTWLFVADSEVVLKVCVLGKQRYWLELGNRFDAFVTLAALLASLCVLVPNGYNVRALIRSVYMFPILRLLRLFKAVPLFRQIFETTVASEVITHMLFHGGGVGS